jgi:hypothetical protein
MLLWLALCGASAPAALMPAYTNACHLALNSSNLPICQTLW